jgi:hypothetical protein
VAAIALALGTTILPQIVAMAPASADNVSATLVRSTALWDPLTRRPTRPGSPTCRPPVRARISCS